MSSFGRASAKLRYKWRLYCSELKLRFVYNTQTPEPNPVKGLPRKTGTVGARLRKERGRNLWRLEDLMAPCVSAFETPRLPGVLLTPLVGSESWLGVDAFFTSATNGLCVRSKNKNTIEAHIDAQFFCCFASKPIRIPSTSRETVDEHKARLDIQLQFA